jgi:hypothetical protein
MMAVWSQTVLSAVKENYGRFDAEYYKPKFLETERILCSIEGAKLGNVCSKIDVGHVGPMVRFYSDNGITLLQTQNVREFFIDLEHCIKVTPEFHSKLAKSQVRKENILIARSGSFGCAAIYLEDQIINSADIIIVELNDPRIDPLFAVTFMNTKHGSNQLVRFSSGGIQGHVNLRILEHFSLPIFEEAVQEEVSAKVQSAYDARNASAESYQQAQQLLESKLGLDKLSFQKPVGYTARFSELEQSRRSDSEFFNPELRYFWKNLSRRFELMAISKFTSVLKFSNPTYGRNGIPIVTQKHLRTISPEGYGDELRTTDSWQRVNYGAVLQQNDLLFYSVGAYLGKTNIWLNSDKAVPASFITLLRCKNEKNAGFLQVLLNSRYGILQSKCFQSGTSQQYIYPKDIRKFLIPVVNDNLKEKLHLLVVESFEKGLEAKNLLHQAKTLVEQLIEEAVQS